MKEKVLKNYLLVTIDEVPQISLIDEVNISDKILLASPIFHSWLRNDEVGVVGIKFSSWMINQGYLSKKEKAVITKWSGSDSDFEIYFGPTTEHNSKSSLDEVVLFTSIIKLDKTLHGISFPMFGATIDKGEMERLESIIPRWGGEKQPEPEEPEE
jgi:hypothetical protein